MMADSTERAAKTIKSGHLGGAATGAVAGAATGPVTGAVAGFSF
jgi:hypothetical protein